MIPNNKTLFINFQEQQIAVQGPHLVVDNVARRFQVMLIVSPTNIAGRLVVRSAQKGFVVLADWLQEPIEAGSLAEVCQIVEHEIALWHIRLQSQYLWLHAGAVALQNKGILFLGEWGQGKSSLVTELYRQNWRFCSDDRVPWLAAENRLLPFPQTPRVRRATNAVLPRQQVDQLARQSVPLNPTTTCTESVPVSLVIALVYDAHCSPRLTPLPPSQGVLAMTQALINRERHRETAVSHFVNLLTRVPAYQLTYNDRTEAARLVANEVRST